MKHNASSHFWKLYDELPRSVQDAANKTFAQLRADPWHPSIHFKKLGRLWSARVGLHHRCLAVETDDGFVWIWIGSHAEYDKHYK